MLRSLVQPSSRSLTQVSGTWSKLFHNRKSLLSDLRSGTSRLASEDGEKQKSEKKFRSPDKQKYRPSDKGRRSISDRDERSFDRQELRHNRESTNSSWKRQHKPGSERKTFSDGREESRFERNDYSVYNTGLEETPEYRRIFPRSTSERNFDRKGQSHNSEFSSSRWNNKTDKRGNKDSIKPLSLKKRVFTEDELLEEEEFRKSDVEESDSGDRFGDVLYKAEAKYSQKNAVRRAGQGKNWSDTFGTISIKTDPTLEDALFSEDQTPRAATDRISADEMFDDDDDGLIERPHIPLSRRNRRHVPNWYARRIEKLGKKGMVKEAIEVFDKWMIERDRVKPTHYEYGLMITLLGRAGYVQKAFNLFYQMQQMDLVPEPKVFTSLFNACSKSPIKAFGLKRANKLRSLMIEQGIEPTLITYQAMISAFGMCGDTEMAFSLVDEVLQKHRPDTNLLCSALVACISDREAGFRHAILVWRKLVQRGVKPNLPSYNLLLRAIKECGVGPLTRDNNLLLIEAVSQEQDGHHGNRTDKKQVVSSLQMKVDPDNLNSASVVEVIEGVDPADKNRISQGILADTSTVYRDSEKHIHGHTEDVMGTNTKLSELSSSDGTVKHWWEYDLEKFTDSQAKSLVQTKFTKESKDLLDFDPEKMPHILDPFDRTVQVVSLGTIATKEDRLSLIGGMKGYLSSLETDGIAPDHVTFNQLMSVVAPSEENEVLDMMVLYDVKPDIDFYNHLIFKKVRRGEWQPAFDIRRMIEERGLVPNIQTYGCWAQACRARDDGKKLLEDMEAANLQPNTAIMQSLVKASYLNFSYKLYLLLQMKELGIPATTALIERIEKSINQAKQIIVKKEKGEHVPDFCMHEDFESRFWKFLDFYNQWLTEIPFKKEKHPWDEFRVKSVHESES